MTAARHNALLFFILFTLSTSPQNFWWAVSLCHSHDSYPFPTGKYSFSMWVVGGHFRSIVLSLWIAWANVRCLSNFRTFSLSSITALCTTRHRWTTALVTCHWKWSAHLYIWKLSGIPDFKAAPLHSFLTTIDASPGLGLCQRGEDSSWSCWGPQRFTQQFGNKLCRTWLLFWCLKVYQLATEHLNIS